MEQSPSSRGTPTIVTFATRDNSPSSWGPAIHPSVPLAARDQSASCWGPPTNSTTSLATRDQPLSSEGPAAYAAAQGSPTASDTTA
jgi:hypothetical protein